ncbi:MAG: hypothetical protein WBZ29_05665 [Methanocella sp.]
MLQGGSVLVIECREAVEVYDVTNLVARADSLVVIMDRDFSNWRGTMSLDSSINDIEKLYLLQDRILTIAFKCKNKSYTGLITIVLPTADAGDVCRVEFRGVDLLRVI